MPHCIRKMLAWHNSIYRSAGNGKPVAASREFLPLNGRGKETKKTADVTSAARAMGSGPGD